MTMNKLIREYIDINEKIRQLNKQKEAIKGE